MLRAALLVLSGNLAASLLLLIRNLVIARLIGVENYGIAATFAIAMAVVEMMSALGLQQQIVQARDGEDPRFQAGLQGFQVLRGALAAIVLFVLAEQISAFFGVPEVAWAYQVLALVPLLNALIHFDVYRLNRHMVFLPVVLTSTVPALVSLVVVWPLTVWLGDYRVMLYALVTQYALMALTSHLTARQPYRWVFDRAIIARSLAYGWPILVNGALLFVVFNGDKIIVARELGTTELGLFAMGLTLTLTPALVIEKSAQSLFLPRLSRLWNDNERARFETAALATVQTNMAAGLLLMLGVMLLGTPLIGIVLGAEYAPLAAFLPWLAILQVVRLWKTGSSTINLARSRTQYSMYISLPRVALLPLGYWVAVKTGDIVPVILVAILAETLGLAMNIWLMRHKLGLPVQPLRIPGLLMAAALAVPAIALQMPEPALGPGVFVATAVLSALALSRMTALGQFLGARLRRRFSPAGAAARTPSDPPGDQR